MRFAFFLQAISVAGAALTLPPNDGNFFIMQFGKTNSTRHMASLTIGADSSTV